MHFPLARLLILLSLVFSSPAASQISDENSGFPCIIQPSDVVSLPSNIGGILSTMDVALGDRVQKGQVLAELDSRMEKVQNGIAKASAANDLGIRSAEFLVELRQSRVERLAALVKANANSKYELEEANASLELARQELELRQFEQEIRGLELRMSDLRMDFHQVISPMDGVVSEKLRSVGQYVDQNTPLYTIAKINPLKVKTILPVEYYDFVKTGGPAFVVPEEPFSGDFQGEVAAIDWIFEAASGTFSIEVTLANADYKIPAGHRCRVSFSY